MAIFGGKKLLEKEIDQLRERNTYLEQNMSPEMKACDMASARLTQLQNDVAKWQVSYDSFFKSVNMLKEENEQLSHAVEEKKNELAVLDDEIMAEGFGLYRPRFDFASSSQYKDALKSLRVEQRQAIKSANEAAKSTNWTVNNSKSQGRKMVCDLQKLLIRAFNSECDELVSKVKFSNIDKTVERIVKSADTASKLGSVTGVRVPHEYVQLKTKEAYLAYEYAVIKEKEKEAIREAKAQEREELKVQKEIEEKRKQLRKEETQYEKALSEAKSKIENAVGEELEALKAKIAALEANISEVKKGISDVDYREANKRAGFVYVISNIGSFGESIYKIGMTRRLEPMERISELSDASVPFNFDVHALIFSDDAPGLEAALHREFEGRKLNLVNTRREFFKCSLDEIKEAILKNYDKTVDFVDFPDAEQFRISEKMRQSA